MIPEGEYPAAIEKVLVTTAQSGNPQMEVVCFIDENTRKVVYLPLTEKAMTSWVAETLQSIGFNGDFEAPAFDQKYYDDYALTLYCKHDEWQGKPKERWSIGGGGSRNPEAGNDILKRLNAKYRALAGNKPKPAGGPPPKSESKAPPPKQSAPPPQQEKPFGRDEAWAQLEAAAEKSGKSVDTDEWYASINRVGDNEDKFGPDEWRKVVEGYVPF